MKWINDLKVKQKLLIVFLTMTFFVGIVGFTGIMNIRKINSSQEFVYNINYPGIKNLSNIKSNLIQINFNIYKILHNEPDRGNLIKEIDRLRDTDDNLIEEYKKTILLDEDREMFTEFNNLLAEYRSSRADFVDDIVNKGQQQDVLIKYTRFEEISNKLIAYMDRYINYNINFAKESHIKNVAVYNSTLLINGIIIFLSLLLSLILGNVIASRASKKIKNVMLFSESLCNGDFENAIDIDSKDEIGVLATSLNKASTIRKDYEIRLNKNYQELEASYEEVTALEEELREKYDELSESEEKLRDIHEWYKMIMEASYDILFDWYIQADKIILSKKWYEITGNDDTSCPMNVWTKTIHPDDIVKAKILINNHWKNRDDSFSMEYRIIVEDNKELWVLATGKTLYDEIGNPLRSVGTLRNITETKNYQENLEYMAYHDYLTGLPNRQYMYQKLKPFSCSLNNADSPSEGAVIFIDLDNFKYINDTMGHNFGDILIKTIGQRLKDLITDKDHLIRIGGDEFVIFKTKITSKSSVTELAENILSEFITPFEIEKNSLKITTSIGIALFPQDGIEIDALLKKADIAMYNSKYRGKNNYMFFVNDMNENVLEKVKIENHLGKALINDEFKLFYQPQVKVQTGEITGFEALIRWNNPELGFVPPNKFIPIAEENNMIIDIGNWVLKTACKFIKTVHETTKNYTCISVNTSVLQIMQSDFIDNICDSLKEADLSPHFLEIEITESIFIDSFEVIQKKIEILKNIGVKISLDDFGKGYSSLSYLKQLPINTLKIDKSFIDDINSINSSCLVEDIIMIGHKMNLDIVAEGVELKEQLIYLRSFQCDKIQGYFFSKPLNEVDALSLISSSKNITIRQAV